MPQVQLLLPTRFTVFDIGASLRTTACKLASAAVLLQNYANSRSIAVLPGIGKLLSIIMFRCIRPLAIFVKGVIDGDTKPM